MKRFLLISAIALAFTSCVEDGVNDSLILQLVSDELTVGFEESDTRIELNSLQKAVWTAGDEVSVFYKSYENLKWRFQGETGDRYGVLKHVGGSVGEQVMSDVVIVYPYNEEYMINLDTKSVEAHMPAVQQYHKDSYDPAVNIMVACGDSRNFVLRNVCGWIKVSLTGDGEKLEYITLRGNNSEQVAGDIVVDTAKAAAEFIAIDGESADSMGVGGGLEFEGAILDSVTLDCEGVILGSSAKDFYIALPPMTFKKGLAIEVKCRGYEPMTKSVSSKVNITRNHIQPLDTVRFESESSGPNVEVDSEIVLGQSSVTASLDGGSYLVEYTVNYLGEGENPHAGVKITAEAAEDWVNNFGYSVTGVLQFNVDANTSAEERKCLVTVKYPYAEDVVFVVKQGAKIMKGFKIENVTSTYFDYTVDVIPEDKSTPYIVMSASPDYIVSSGFETGEDYYEDDYAYFGWLGQFYGQSATQYMQARAKVGNQYGLTVSGATAGIPYTFYCYYFDY